MPKVGQRSIIKNLSLLLVVSTSPFLNNISSNASIREARIISKYNNKDIKSAQVFPNLNQPPILQKKTNKPISIKVIPYKRYKSNTRRPNRIKARRRSIQRYPRLEEMY